MLPEEQLQVHRERFKSALPAVTELERFASAATAQLMDAQGAQGWGQVCDVHRLCPGMLPNF
jgi:hypothetical protein